MCANTFIVIYKTRDTREAREARETRDTRDTSEAGKTRDIWVQVDQRRITELKYSMPSRLRSFANCSTQLNIIY